MLQVTPSNDGQVEWLRLLAEDPEVRDGVGGAGVGWG